MRKCKIDTSQSNINTQMIFFEIFQNQFIRNKTLNLEKDSLNPRLKTLKSIISQAIKGNFFVLEMYRTINGPFQYHLEGNKGEMVEVSSKGRFRWTLEKYNWDRISLHKEKKSSLYSLWLNCAMLDWAEDSHLCNLK